MVRMIEKEHNLDGASPTWTRHEGNAGKRSIAERRAESAVLHGQNEYASERRMAGPREAELQEESEARFRLLAENCTDIISRCTSEGVLLYVSPACRTLLGCEPEEIVGRSLSEFIHPDDFSRVQETITTVLDVPEMRMVCSRFRRADGNYAWFETTCRGVRDPRSNHMAEVYSTSRDVTERVRIAEALRLAHDELEERVRERTSELVVANAALESQARELTRSNAELQQFAYVASHDLQEPLRMVSSYTQLLARRYKDRLEGDALEFIAYAVDGATRMQQLINDLLAYSRVGTRGKAFAPTAVDDVVERAIGNLRATVDESHAEVTCDPLPTVMADGGQLVQLFQNLVGNAIKYRGEEPPRVHVSAAREVGDWHFVVRDNGIGIDPQYAERIFEIFQRLHTREKYSGTGIGLAICRKIVDRHRGRIWVESQAGMGATFHFTIPEQTERNGDN